MNSIEKIKQLQGILRDTLTPMIDSDYVLLDLPYYSNYGDTLIWEGERLFLKTLPYKCLFQTNAYGYKGEIFSDDVIILLQGGGNFGDIWTLHNDLRKSVIANHPNNKIIIFPQTVFYNDDAKLKSDANFFAKYKNVTICARDHVTYNVLKTNFSNEILLLPDMAFFIDAKQYLKGVKSNNKTLFVKRQDVELKFADTPSFIPKDADIYDWPAPELLFVDKVYSKLRTLCRRIDRVFNSHTILRIEDIYRDKILRKRYINIAVDFLEKYEDIYTTRLHVMILSVLLGKSVHLLDNSYGKNSSFYESWLKDIDNVEYIDYKH